MLDGRPCPDRHDGMAVVTTRQTARGDEHVLDTQSRTRIRFSIVDDHGARTLRPWNDRWPQRTRRHNESGVSRCDSWVSVEPSLGGTLINCAGGATPWGSWLTCEETLSNRASTQGKRHGYVFEVAANASQTTGNPIVAMGRFSHEAAAVDPATGYVYLTEDLRNVSGFYRFIPNDARGRLGSLGGRWPPAGGQGSRGKQHKPDHRQAMRRIHARVDRYRRSRSRTPARSAHRSCAASTPIRAAAVPSFRRGRRARCSSRVARVFGIRRARCTSSTRRRESMVPIARAAARVLCGNSILRR